jgi:hypothetical protein
MKKGQSHINVLLLHQKYHSVGKDNATSYYTNVEKTVVIVA